jgi:hypothetical protein
MTVGEICGQPCSTGAHDIAISRRSGSTAALHVFAAASEELAGAFT